jgi:transcriptional regulator with XRE-family HTH domain
MLEFGQLAELRCTAIDDAPNRLRLALRLAGKTQAEVARAIEMSPPHFNDVCSGRVKEVSLTTAHKLANYFGCAIEDLFPSRPANGDAVALSAAADRGEGAA